jgi:hypothetical protein
VSRKLFEEDATQPRQRRNRIRVLLWLLVLLLLVTIATLVTLITVKPDLVGLVRAVDMRQTDSAVQSTFIALQLTDQNNLQRELNVQNTQAALDNFASRLAQTETQQIINSDTTATAVAIANAQQATRAAQDFQSTQAALQQISTQIQEEFEATQTALNSSFATIEANRPPENVMILDGNFVRGVEAAASIPPTTAWAVSDRGILIAQIDDATALIRPVLTPLHYTINARITPKSTQADYDILLALVEDQTGYILRLYHDGEQLTGAALMPGDESVVLSEVNNLTLTASELAVEVLIDNSQIQAVVNGLPLLTLVVADLNQGMSGVRLPAGAQLQTLLFVPRG